ncbi:uncharacterized protein DNG_10033 [Cephalotrichum gorgonifer]|uniref:TRP C-terminal domain-containing protein n=1 Tax=Cephalotrichum gorgonifer TaxID=2041049 RepID=A0AAE8N861_9PEZI|nr:uncharacterized protein DNG_10033 [Cephalotrichum gorgonifer]
MLLNHLTALCLVAPALGAYVQWHHCHGAESAAVIASVPPESFRAAVSLANDTGTANLQFYVTTTVDDEDCDRGHDVSDLRVDFEMLGGDSVVQASPNVSCEPAPHTPGRSILKIESVSDIGTLHALSTFYVAVHFDDQGEEVGCLSAEITPVSSKSIVSVLRYCPAALFLFVLVVAILRTVYDDTDAPVSDDDESFASNHYMRTLLPGLGDLLHYMQFIFLTASLSLRYPGFYQPAASKLNWFSLFSGTGLFTHSRTYSGVNDGIYEINGTYGGTFGLEHMTQIVGAPMTMSLWLNMAITVVLMGVGLAVLVEIMWYLNKRQRWWSGDESQDFTGVRYTTGQVFRAILSYFLLPIVSLSTYQFDHAMILPAYHTGLAAGLLFVIAMAFLWLLSQIPTRSLGALIFDGSKRYTRLESSPSRGGDASFIIILFVLTFIRAAAIGGLQLSPVAQIVILATCEVVLLACIIGFQAYPAISVGVACTLARLCSVLLMTVFLPDIASLKTKSFVAYLLLLLHTAVLIFAFFFPTVYHLAKLCVRRVGTETPQVFGLRQLRRREMPQGNLTQHSNLDSIEEGGGFGLEPHNGGLHPTPRSDSPSSLHLNEPSRYYRPPRSSSPRPILRRKHFIL